MRSRSLQFRDYSDEAKRKIAMQIWKNSGTAKNLLGDEQMFFSWGQQYKAMSELSYV
jgi:hypothetical protein